MRFHRTTSGISKQAYINDDHKVFKRFKSDKYSSNFIYLKKNDVVSNNESDKGIVNFFQVNQ